jgi:H+/Cl- antiporter ClcA
VGILRGQYPPEPDFCHVRQSPALGACAMPFRWNPREHLAMGIYVLRWAIFAIPTGIIIGSAVALFLWSLEVATQTRFNYPWLLYLLPVAGIGIGLLYNLFGKSVEAGNNLIIDEIHEPGGGVPIRMTPLVLIGTVITHLFGGSAGREGTAIQMGGSIASKVSQILRIKESDTRILLMCGVAAGFGAVFGTPGAIFALEVLTIGQMSYEAIIPCLIASIAGNECTQAWGIHHTQYHIGALSGMKLVQSLPRISWLLMGKVAIAAIAFGLASVIFAELAHGLHRIFKWLIPWPTLRPAVGGLIVIGLVFALGTRDYLGLGVVADPHHPDGISILSSFHDGGANWFSWWWKILFTAVTLSSGFKGGEVTPLFFIGAALGNTMARLLHAPIDLFAGLGFVAVFAGATNTPLACTIMGIELFMSGQQNPLGSGFVIYLSIACFLAYLFSGHTGIYLSQRIGTPKISSPSLPAGASLRSVRDLHE